MSQIYVLKIYPFSICKKADISEIHTRFNQFSIGKKAGITHTYNISFILYWKESRNHKYLNHSIFSLLVRRHRSQIQNILFLSYL